jgi:hypothetical protein
MQKYQMIFFSLTLIIASSEPAEAQARRYRPSRPTVSPYLNLLRPDVGPLPNYHALVRPQLEQQITNKEIAAALEANSKRLQFLQSGQGRVRDSGVRATGISGGFQSAFNRSGSSYFRYPRVARVRR